MMPQIFGWEHLTFLAIFFAVTIGGTILIKKFAKSEKSQDIIVRILGFFLFVFVVWNRLSIAILGGSLWKIIPDSFCGMTSLVFSLALMFGKRNNAVLHFVVYLGFVGGLLTILYPDFISTYSSFLHTITISGILHHATSFYLSILLQIIGWFIPNWRKWYCLLIGTTAYILLGLFQIYVLNFSKAFYINKPAVSGTPLTVWVIIPIFAVGYTLYMVILEQIRKYRAKKKDVVEKMIEIIKS